MDTNRSGNVELTRFISALIIVSSHLLIMGFSNYKFRDGWIFVEYFLIITGYYTVKHFDGKNYSNPMKESFKYTLRKFIPFLPYTTIATILMYLLIYIPKLVSGELNIKGFLFSFTDNFIFDILLISESYSFPLVGTLWYLSAMFIVFPFFTWFIQLDNRYWIIFITSIYPLFYYGIVGIFGTADGYLAFLRLIAGLCIGTFIYEIIYVFSDYINRINKVLLTIIEVITFLFPIVIIFNNLISTRFILFCFIVCLSIMLPGLSYTNKIREKLVNYLGKLSMPIFIFHWLIGNLIQTISNYYMWDTKIKCILYYGATLIVSMIALYLVQHWKWFQEVIKQPIILKD